LNISNHHQLMLYFVRYLEMTQKSLRQSSHLVNRFS